ncbi:MAG: hypothetical protein JNL08_12150 [Planctomycetes bacterium]|nr:hypothetical protein [Planctomycetota bacterium]
MRAVTDFLLRLLRLHDATRDERRAAFWTAVAFCGVLFAYYLLRPLRENVASAFAQQDLLWLFVLTLVLTTALNQPYVALVRRLPSHRFLPYALHAFAISFVALAAVFAGHEGALGPLGWQDGRDLGYAFFYSWVTAFSVCGVTLVWVHAVEWFSPQQGKRLFGLVSVGGTLGAMLGSKASKALAGWSYGEVLLLAAVAVELAIVAWWCALRACRTMGAARPVAAPAPAPAPAPAAVPSFARGVRRVVTDPYLRGIALFVLIAAVAATTFYYQRIALARELLFDDAARRSVEADINFWQNALCLGLQLVLTSRVLLFCGIAVALCTMPVASFVGLMAFGQWPLVPVYATVEVLRRMLQFGIDKPAREVLSTALGRDDKYVAKAVIDTAVLRTGDVLGALVNDLLLRLQIGGAGLLGFAAPLFAAWAGIGVWLGRRCRERSG